VWTSTNVTFEWNFSKCTAQHPRVYVAKEKKNTRVSTCLVHVPASFMTANRGDHDREDALDFPEGPALLGAHVSDQASRWRNVNLLEGSLSSRSLHGSADHGGPGRQRQSMNSTKQPKAMTSPVSETRQDWNETSPEPGRKWLPAPREMSPSPSLHQPK
jgi:hypothetical protein